MGIKYVRTIKWNNTASTQTNGLKAMIFPRWESYYSLTPHINHLITATNAKSPLASGSGCQASFHPLTESIHPSPFQCVNVESVPHCHQSPHLKALAYCVCRSLAELQDHPSRTPVQGGAHRVMALASWGLLTTDQFAMGSLGREVAGKALPVGCRCPSAQRELGGEGRGVLQLVHH